MKINKSYFWEGSYSLFRLQGSGVKDFLHGQTTIDIYSSDLNRYSFTCWLSTKGFVRALLEISLDDKGADVLVFQGNSEDVLEGFDKVIFPADKVGIVSHKKIRRVQIISQENNIMNDRVLRLAPGEPYPSFFKAYHKLTENQFEIWRLEHGIPCYPNEINGRRNPFEIGLSNLISIDKGCYLGQEAISRQLRNTVKEKKIMFWESSHSLESGERLFGKSTETTSKSHGVITSSVESIESASNFGLAIVSGDGLNEKELFVKDFSKSIRISMPKQFLA